MSALDDATTLLAAASRTPDRDARVMYLARARVLLERQRDDVRRAIANLEALEKEVARTAEVAT